jgi:hypothetical protein
VLLVLALVVDYVDSALPLGSRTSVSSTLPSDEQDFVGRFWYEDTEARALSAELATAAEGTDWCLGWAIIIVDDAQFGDEQADIGSSQGVNTSARTCPDWVEIEVVYHYTSSSSELEDNATFAVWSSDLDVAGVFEDHPTYQVSAADLLHEDRGDNRDDVIGNAIAGMPLVLSEAGVLDPVSVEPVAEGTEGAVTFADREGEGGSDLWRAEKTRLLVAGLVVALGLTLAFMAWARVPSSFFGTPVPGARGPDGRPINPRRALKAALQRARIEEEQRGPGRSHR